MLAVGLRAPVEDILLDAQELLYVFYEMIFFFIRDNAHTQQTEFGNCQCHGLNVRSSDTDRLCRKCASIEIEKKWGEGCVVETVRTLYHSWQRMHAYQECTNSETKEARGTAQNIDKVANNERKLPRTLYGIQQNGRTHVLKNTEIGLTQRSEC